jgi:long-chain fatty acid transport protein
MKKRIALILTTLVLPSLMFSSAIAGGIDNKQNFSARYLATGSRNAATDGVDIAAYNPAGIMQQENGLAISLDVHYIWKDYEHTYNQFNPSAQVTRTQDEPSIVPGLFAKYTQDRWGAFGSVTISGGGGKVAYDQGNIITNKIEASLFLPAPAGFGFGAAGLISNEWIKAESHYLTYTAGISHKFTDQFSAALGFRYVDASKEVDAFANTAALGNLAGAYEETADGWGWLASINYKPAENLLLAARYESEVSLEFEADFDSGNTALGNNILAGLGKTDGGKSDRNLPALLGLGVAWDVTDRLNLNTSLTYYFEENADWDGEENDVNNGWDWGVSGTYSIRDNLRVSLGYMRTHIDYDADDFDLVAQMSPPLSAHSFFAGLGYDFSEKLTANCGLLVAIYDEDGTIGTTTAEYDKQNTALGLGVEYRF